MVRSFAEDLAGERWIRLSPLERVFRPAPRWEPLPEHPATDHVAQPRSCKPEGTEE